MNSHKPYHDGGGNGNPVLLEDTGEWSDSTFCLADEGIMIRASWFLLVCWLPYNESEFLYADMLKQDKIIVYFLLPFWALLALEQNPRTTRGKTQIFDVFVRH